MKLIEILMSTKEIDEMIEVSEILTNFSFSYISYSLFLLESCPNLLDFMQRYLSNFTNFTKENYIIFFNFIFILTNCLNDNNSKNWNLQELFFTHININTIFTLFEEYFTLPVYGRHFVIWFAKNILQTPQINQPSNFDEILKTEILKFLTKEKVILTYTKIFNMSGLINESTKEIMNFFKESLTYKENFDFLGATQNCKFTQIFEDIFGYIFGQIFGNI